MQLSNSGLQKIVQREGVILHTYKDSVGVLTIGTGHTSAAGAPKVVPGMVITKTENDTILRRDLAPIVKQVNSTVKVPITQNQFDALVSIIFNVGPKFLTSTCMKRLNQKDYKGAAEAIMLWNKPPEIIGRRRTEMVQFQTPDAKGAGAAGAVVVGAGGAAAAAPHGWFTWPHIGELVAGIVAFAILVEVAIHYYHKYKQS